MDPLKLFDVYDKDTQNLMMTIEARDTDQAIERVVLISPHLDALLTTGGLIVLREHDPETPVTSPFFFRDGHFLLLKPLSLSQH